MKRSESKRKPTTSSDELLMFALNNESAVLDEIRTLIYLDAAHGGQRHLITHEFAKRLEIAQRLSRNTIAKYRLKQ